MYKVTTETGFVAISKSDPKKGLKNYWKGGVQTGTNAQALTTDIEEFTLVESDTKIKMYCDWYNRTHKKQVEFEILRVERVKTVTLDQHI